MNHSQRHLGPNKTVKFIVEGKEYVLDTGLIGGLLAGKDPNLESFGLYVGKRSIEDIGISFLHSVRATIKTLRHEFDMSPKDVMDLLFFTVETGLKMEAKRTEVDAWIEKILTNLTKDN